MHIPYMLMGMVIASAAGITMFPAHPNLQRIPLSTSDYEALRLILVGSTASEQRLKLLANLLLWAFGTQKVRRKLDLLIRKSFTGKGITKQDYLVLTSLLRDHIATL
jgi:hypothetical protein